MRKFKSVSPIKADSSADIALINEHAIAELTPDEVFCFSMILCDNEVDRDLERFTDDSLEKMSDLFLGKTMLFDHRWSAEGQVARIYRTFTEKLPEKNSIGEGLMVLRGSAYMIKAGNEEIIGAIEAGILKEVSIGGSFAGAACSICGTKFRYNWEAGAYLCENVHAKGETYDGKLCFGELVDPSDAYEVSFVAVPAQPGAGVTKDFVIDDMSKEDRIELIRKLKLTLVDDAERAERARIIEENKKFVEGKIK